MRFMAMASVSCASALIDPNDIAPVEKRLTIDSTGSTSSSGIGAPADLKSKSRAAWPAGAPGRRPGSRYSLKIRYWPPRVACCSLNTVSGLNRWYSPSRRHWYSPPQSRSGCADRPLRKRLFVPARATSSEITLDADAFDARRRPGEVPVDERLAQADGLEDLGAAVAGERRDAHLGHHLEDALVERLDVVAARPSRASGRAAAPAGSCRRASRTRDTDSPRPRRSRAAARSGALRARRPIR